jgi:hypothetical protein
MLEIYTQKDLDLALLPYRLDIYPYSLLTDADVRVEWQTMRGKRGEEDQLMIKVSLASVENEIWTWVDIEHELRRLMGRKAEYGMLVHTQIEGISYRWWRWIQLI